MAVSALGTAEEVKAGAATAVGGVEGVNGPCDVNWCYVGYARLIRELGKNKPIEREAALGTVVVATKLCKTTSELTTAQNQLKTLGYDYTLHTVE